MRNSETDALARPGCEVHTLSVPPYKGGNLGTGRLNKLCSFLSIQMIDAIRVAERSCHGMHDHGCDTGINGSRSVMIEVDRSAPFPSTHASAPEGEVVESPSLAGMRSDAAGTGGADRTSRR
jgi:hypothetical protein